MFGVYRRKLSYARHKGNPLRAVAKTEKFVGMNGYVINSPHNKLKL